ncbi:MAG: glycosyltransferase family 39 protein [Cyanobacteriota bacterium]|nr:glycosyltransferase family 39 protein [Cyanobacteriota bacterium]
MFSFFGWGSPNPKTPLNDKWVDLVFALGLLLAALLLYGINLGELPLRDWDEGIVAQVAREIGRGDWNWLYPTVNDTPYFNKPPLVHWSIALSYAIGGVNEWTARWPPAMLTAISVPLVYLVGRELFRLRTTAMFGGLVYLTLFPVVRHGRLAMLDGAVVCFFLLTIWCALRSRRNLRYALASGIAFGLLCLTKGVVLGLLLGAIALLFLLWDTPRLLTSRYLWGGIFLGIVPVLLWYGAQFVHYGMAFVNANLIHQSLRRVWRPVGSHEGALWYYLLEIVEFTWPWLLFWPPSLRLIWENRNLSWGKLILVWTGVYLLAISLMSTKLPWYIFPLYPAFALAVGSYFSDLWYQTPPMDLGVFGREFEEDLPAEDEMGAMTDGFQTKEMDAMGEPGVYHRSVVWLLGLLAFIAWGGCLYLISARQLPGAQLMLLAVGLTVAIAAWLLHRRDRQFLVVLFWGTYISLLLFVSSNLWVWELKEDYAVKPVAEIVRKYAPAREIVYTFDDKDRPSLNFYSDRQIKRVGFAKVQQEWKGEKQVYLLVEESTLPKIFLEDIQVLGTAEGWALVTRQ